MTLKLLSFTQHLLCTLGTTPRPGVRSGSGRSPAQRPCEAPSSRTFPGEDGGRAEARSLAPAPVTSTRQRRAESCLAARPWASPVNDDLGPGGGEESGGGNRNTGGSSRLAPEAGADQETVLRGWGRTASVPSAAVATGHVRARALAMWLAPRRNYTLNLIPL